MIELTPVQRDRLEAFIKDQRSVFDFERLFDAVIELQTMVAASDPYTAAPGDIVYSAGTTRAQALAANGALHLRADYPALFAAIGTTYGTTLATNFRVPDITGRVIAGKEAAATRLTTAKSGIDGATLGATGGLQEHTLVLNEIPSHNHGGATSSDGAHTHLYDRSSTGINVNNAPAVLTGTSNVLTSTATNSQGAHTHTVSSAGGGLAHFNCQPTIVLNAFILY